MLSREELDALRDAIPADPDRAILLDRLRERAAPLRNRPPVVPRVKALLSRDGGVCPDDRTPLRFDPWNGERHSCPRCGRTFSGDRHHRHWARAQHLWLAERMAELSVVSALTEDGSEARAIELYAAYDGLYFELPNRDNVLGPSHLFFSTYLESLWITSYLAGAFMLRECGKLSEDRIAGINQVADEAAAIIGEFDEGFSNRQTWNAAALTAIAAWFGDEELGKTAVESRTGLLGHLADGFGNDGAWWEGENYHLFALRGLMQGIHWARALGYDLLDDRELRDHFRAALLAPTLSALPDFTYPARRDSRFGVSLAQPPSLELWEIGRAWLGGDPKIESWLAALYAQPAPPPGLQYDAWLHDAGPTDARAGGRRGLSWWALAAMGGPPPPDTAPWAPESVVLSSQGLAVLRRGDRYAGLECGHDIGGHGHPDRLHLTLHADGVHWLPDPGTGSYVEPELAWYRSALAHNAPRVDGANAAGADAFCSAFDVAGEWSWCRAAADRITRTLVLGPDQLVDLLELDVSGERMDLPWHLDGAEVESPGTWVADEWREPFLEGTERFEPVADGALVLRAAGPDGRTLRVHLLAPGAVLWRASAPGLPGSGRRAPFLALRAPAGRAAWLAVVDFARDGSGRAVESVIADGGRIELRHGGSSTHLEMVAQGLRISGAERADLGGLRPRARTVPPKQAQTEVLAIAPRLADPPALDGSLDGFDTEETLVLDSELQYRRSEDPYEAEEFHAQAWVNWDGTSLYLAVHVAKPDVIFRDPAAASLDLDNEPEDINGDCLQVYLRIERATAGVLVTPLADGTVNVRAIGEEGGLGVSGRWSPTDDGYLVTLAIEEAAIRNLHPGSRIGFDLIVNEMRPGRQRRAGQLVWSSHRAGWVYLRGDRHDSAELGTLQLG